MPRYTTLYLRSVEWEDECGQRWPWQAHWMFYLPAPMQWDEPQPEDDVDGNVEYQPWEGQPHHADRDQRLPFLQDFDDCEGDGRTSLPIVPLHRLPAKPPLPNPWAPRPVAPSKTPLDDHDEAAWVHIDRWNRRELLGWCSGMSGSATDELVAFNRYSVRVEDLHIDAFGGTLDNARDYVFRLLRRAGPLRSITNPPPAEGMVTFYVDFVHAPSASRAVALEASYTFGGRNFPVYVSRRYFHQRTGWRRVRREELCGIQEELELDNAINPWEPFRMAQELAERHWDILTDVTLPQAALPPCHPFDQLQRFQQPPKWDHSYRVRTGGMLDTHWDATVRVRGGPAGSGGYAERYLADHHLVEEPSFTRHGRKRVREDEQAESLEVVDERHSAERNVRRKATAENSLEFWFPPSLE